MATARDQAAIEHISQREKQRRTKRQTHGGKRRRAHKNPVRVTAIRSVANQLSNAKHAASVHVST
jgi:hypothetical protein